MTERAERPPLWLLVLLAGLLILSLGLAAAWYLRPQGTGFESGSVVTASGRADIGGPFSLLDQRGERVTSGSLAGQWLLVTFGFTFCPDVCPTSLANMSQALDRLAAEAPEKAAQVVPLFITIDPARDDVAQLRSYAEHFHPRLLALTGSESEIAEAAKGYRVYYAKAGEGEDYLMDHSAFIYLMGPDGAYVTHFSPTTDAATMAAALKERVGS